MSKVYVVTSGKGGVGKTATAINLGAAMNHFGEDVLVIDGNLSTPNVGLHLNSPEVPINLNHVLLGKAEPFESVYEHESGLKVLPASISVNELKKLKYDRLKDYKKDFKKIADHVIIDSAAGLGEEAMSVMKLADHIIIVTNPETPALTDALKTIKVAEQMNKPILGAIITRVSKDDIEADPDTVREMLEVPILGMVPEDKDVKKSIHKKNAVVHTHPKSKPSRAYKEIAAKILDIPYNSKKDREKAIIRLLKKLNLKK